MMIFGNNKQKINKKHMKIITTKNGAETMVDDDMYDYLNSFSWCAVTVKGNPKYLMTKYKNKGIYMHRLIMLVLEKDVLIDHKDGNGFNNQRKNLRVCTSQENNRNRMGKINGTSKYKAVSFHKKTKKWETYITINRKKIHLGLFENEIDAAKAYNEKAIELFGEFAKINEI